MTTTATPLTDDLTGVAAVIAAHRRVADLLEAHPDLAYPYVSASEGLIRWTLYSFECPDGVPAMVAAIRRAVGGKWDKREAAGITGTPEMVFEREGYQIITRREAVCVRRVVGTETVTIPARPALDAQPERTEEREIVEWDCEPILSGLGVTA